MQTKSSTIETPSVHTPLKPSKFPADKLDFSTRQSNDRIGFQNAVACLDNTSHGLMVFRHTKAIADGLQIPLKIAHVLQGANPGFGPSDPIQWQLQCREARDHLRQLLDDEHETMMAHDQLMLNGLAGNELARWARGHSGSLMALNTRCNSGRNAQEHPGTNHFLGSTVQRILESSTASMLFIPPGAPDTAVVRYQRIVVPLDGSCRAESILPIAIRIARQQGAELILAHVVPKPEIVESTAYDEEVRDLMDQLRQFNEQNARVYLDRLKTRLRDESVAIKAVVQNEGDPRDRLLGIANEQSADLIIMSARGRSGMTDISCGNIARHIATYSDIPLLMIRQQETGIRDQIQIPQGNRIPRLFWESAH
ncbi:MAG: universal stress protein [Parasphingorhabdus sp.]|uniref:universal stress protein n=1 Tax=Parasphingorhabdus sp. TaxID=2709688 RepID=UPI003002863D